MAFFFVFFSFFFSSQSQSLRVFWWCFLSWSSLLPFDLAKKERENQLKKSRIAEHSGRGSGFAYPCIDQCSEAQNTHTHLHACAYPQTERERQRERKKKKRKICALFSSSH